MKSFSIFLTGLAGIWLWLALLAGDASAQAPLPGTEPGGRARRAVFIVDSTADAVDAVPGNGLCLTAANTCTLRAAIQEANATAGDDVVSLPTGAYTLTLTGAGEDAAATGDLDIAGNLLLKGAGATATLVDGGSHDRILHILGAHVVSITDLTLTHGNGQGGGIRSDGATLEVTNSAIVDNNSGGDAGGILSSGILTIVASNVSDNNARTDAGGILNTGTLFVADSTLSLNNAGDAAGAILSSGALVITGSTFAENNAGAGGGGILHTAHTTVTGSSFFNNNAGAGGGAISSAGILTVSHSTFSENNASLGGGIFDGGGTITVTHSTFAGNSAGSGGGLYTALNVAIANSTFSNNSASDGGEIYTSGGVLTVHNCTLFGEVYDPDRIGSVVPAGAGGGIFNAAGGGGSVTLINTIAAGHEQDGNCIGAITNGGNNLEDGATCGWGAANNSLSNTNPLLGTLTGSPAYFPLSPDSPAVDAGNNVVCAAPLVANEAQNGVSRPVDGDGDATALCDIGAFELEEARRLYLQYIQTQGN